MCTLAQCFYQDDYFFLGTIAFLAIPLLFLRKLAHPISAQTSLL